MSEPYESVPVVQAVDVDGDGVTETVMADYTGDAVADEVLTDATATTCRPHPPGGDHRHQRLQKPTLSTGRTLPTGVGAPALLEELSR